MKPGEMLGKLHEVLRRLKPLLLEGPDSWNSLDVTYEAPRVERLWREVGDLRVYLHRIHPCAEALYHPHPWPSAIRIVSGKYEMGLAASDSIRFQNLIAADCEVGRLVLTEGAEYEMLNPFGWHYVKPLREPSLSIMITTKPWNPPVFNHDNFGKKAHHGALADDVKARLLDAFLYVPVEPNHAWWRV